MPDKTNINKLNAKQIDKLKGKLVEVRRAGSGPIFVEITNKDSVLNCLAKADVPTEDSELKIEGMKEGAKKWSAVKGNDKVMKYARLVVTTKVRGSC